MLLRQSGRPAGNTSKDASEKAGNKAPFTLSRLRGRVPEQSEGGWGLAGETFPYPSLESELARLGPPRAGEGVTRRPQTKMARNPGAISKKISIVRFLLRRRNPTGSVGYRGLKVSTRTVQREN
jgi:hypothetical protein